MTKLQFENILSECRLNDTINLITRYNYYNSIGVNIAALELNVDEMIDDNNDNFLSFYSNDHTYYIPYNEIIAVEKKINNRYTN